MSHENLETVKVSKLNRSAEFRKTARYRQIVQQYVNEMRCVAKMTQILLDI